MITCIKHRASWDACPDDCGIHNEGIVDAEAAARRMAYIFDGVAP